MRTNKVYFIVTKECNSACSFCYMRYGNVNESNINALKSIESTIDHLVVIGGEPLLYKDRVIKVLNMCRHVNEITITTNGKCLSTEFIELIKSYDNVYVQVSIYDYTTALNVSKFVNKCDNIFVHYVLSSDNIDVFRDTHHLFNGNKVWISLDREINKDISSEILDLIDCGDITKSMFRNHDKVGKDCKVFDNTNIIINGSNIIYDCLNRQSKNTNMVVNSDCLKCANNLCDACICNDIVINRPLTCSIFKNIFDKFKYMGEI